MWWGPKVPQRRRYCHSAALGAGASNLRACSHRISTFSYNSFFSTAVGSISSETRICTTRGGAYHISKDEEEKHPCRVGGESRARSVTEEERRRLG